MSALKDRIRADLVLAMKSKDSLKMDTLRLISAEIKNREIGKSALNDDEILSLLASQIKKRREAAEMYDKGGRGDLSKKEMDEIEFIQSYLPEPVSDEILKAKIAEIIKRLGVKSKKEMGLVMKEVIAEFKGRADGKTIKNLVMESLP